VRGLGIRMLTFDTKTSLYTEHPELQVPMSPRFLVVPPDVRPSGGVGLTSDA
jgi:hypothetical protein